MAGEDSVGGVGNKSWKDRMLIPSSPNSPLCTCFWTRVSTDYSWKLVLGVGKGGQMLVCVDH